MPRQLLQIEEPSEQPDAFANRGLAIGLHFAPAGLQIAISVGGNVELIRGEGGGTEFLAAGDDLAESVSAAARRLTAMTGRLITHAVVVVPDATIPSDRLALFQAVETGGLDVLRLIDFAEALTLAPEPAVLGAALLAEEMSHEG